MPREELVKVPAILLGSRLRAKRKALRMSQQQLGRGDFSPSYVSAVERGKIRPSLKALYILADRLGDPVTHFLQDEATVRAVDVAEEAITAALVVLHQGDAKEAIQRLQAVPPADLPSELRARWHLALGRAFLALREVDKAVPEFEAALGLAEQAGNATLAAYARLHLGLAFYQQQKVSVALEYHRRCLQAVTDGSVKDPDFHVLAYASLASDLLYLGQHKEAMGLYKEAMKLADAASTLGSLASTYWSASASARESNDPLGARAYAHRSLIALESLHMLSVAAQVRNTFASVLNGTGDLDAAERAFLEARAAGERVGDRGVAASATVSLGELYSSKKDYAQAEALARQGIEQAAELGDRAVEGQGLLTLAQVCAAQGRREDAERNFAAALAKLKEAGVPDLLSKAYFRFGQALVSWGEAKKGSQYLEKAYLETKK